MVQICFRSAIASKRLTQSYIDGSTIHDIQGGRRRTVNLSRFYGYVWWRIGGVAFRAKTAVDN